MRDEASPLWGSAAKLLSVTMLRRFCFRAVAVASAGTVALVPASLRAQRHTAPADSTPAPCPAPLVTRRDLGALAIGAGVVVLTQRADLTLRRDVRAPGTQANPGIGSLADVGDLWGQPIALVGAAGLWAGGRLAHQPTAAAVGLRAVEAITVSGIVGKVLKGAFGRARPRVNGADAWDVEVGRGFSLSDGDYESMPSGHATAAFAFAAAVTSEVRHRAPRHVRWVGATSFALATTTAYARMHHDAHWLSDVTAGAVLGSVSAWAVTRWHRTRPDNRLDRLLLGVGPSGAALVGASLPWP